MSGRLGCVVVTHQSAEVVGGMLESLGVLEPEAVVAVDHESADGTLKALDRHAAALPLTVLRRPNRGYAAGANAGIAALRTAAVDLVVLLNPDARVRRADRPALHALFDTRAELGSVCPLTLGDDPRRLDSLGLRLTPWAAVADAGQGRPADFRGTAPLPGVVGPCGGSAVYRASALATLPGPFDERFFLYYEDAALALRLRAAGWTTLTSDVVTVQHLRGGLGGRRTAIVDGAARRAAVERQRSYELFVSGAVPLSAPRRLLGRAAARARRRQVAAHLASGGDGG